MNVIIQIENPNEIQNDLIRLLAIQDEIKTAKRDQDKTDWITGTIDSINKIRSEPGNNNGGN